jgi:hypothetical protein
MAKNPLLATTNTKDVGIQTTFPEFASFEAYLKERSKYGQPWNPQWARELMHAEKFFSVIGQKDFYFTLACYVAQRKSELSDNMEGYGFIVKPQTEKSVGGVLVNLEVAYHNFKSISHYVAFRNFVADNLDHPLIAEITDADYDHAAWQNAEKHERSL